MRKFFSGKLLFFIFPLLVLSGCDSTSEPGDVDVSGNWNAPMQIQSCTPASVCSSFGLVTGQTRTARMNLRQDGNNVEGTYTYEGAGLNADVDGRVTGNQLVLDGELVHPLGRLTVHLMGNVSDNEITSQVSHDARLIDGRTGTVSGTGTFHR